MCYLLLAVVSSCTLLEPEQREKLNPAIYYKNDICFNVEGKKFCGSGVIPNKNIIKVKIDSDNNIENFMLTTCGREITTKDPDKGLFKRNGIVKLTLRPTIELDEKVCPFYFAAFTRSGKHAWGFLVVDPQFELKADIKNCNGERYIKEGVAVCETRQGILQQIKFDEPVAMITTNGVAERKENCPDLPLSKDQTYLEFATPNRDCVYFIVGRKSKKKFILYTIGYEQVKVI